MCGRFTLITDLEVLTERFRFHNLNYDMVKPQYNIAPSKEVLTVVNDGEENKAGFLNWGLITHWTKDIKSGYKMINSRIETISTKPSYKYLLERKRCIILADGFYEWKEEVGKKQPYRITIRNNKVFAFAGVWDIWQNEKGVYKSCSIITTKANKYVENIHQRMPVILNQKHEDAWINRNIVDIDTLLEIVDTSQQIELKAYKVTTEVNSPRNNTSECIVPIE